MGLVKSAVISAVVVMLGVWIFRYNQEPPLPYLHPDPWWGPGERQTQDTTIRQFKINIPEKDVEDLKTRLSLPLRVTPGLEGANFTYGMNGETIADIVDQWKNNYDWKKREPRLNKYPHFMTRIEGLDIHFMRARADVGSNKNVRVLPLMMIHGWPGSFVEFYNILPLLTTPQQGSNVVFEVICPSIPGYAFSQGSSKQGLGKAEMAQIFLKLMKRLGYDKFYLQGGDWGSIIATDMATFYPDNVLGIHLNMFNANTPILLLLGAWLPSGLITYAEEDYQIYPLASFFKVTLRESGYLHIQATKPDTIGNALDQHPVSLAIYFLEKFSTGQDSKNQHLPDGGLLTKGFPLPLQDILDNICIYWFTRSATTAARIYAENMGTNFITKSTDGISCRVPAGLADFPEDVKFPRSLVAYKYHDIVTFTRQPSGGHFAAMEVPQLLAKDVHNFVNAVLARK